MSAFATGEQLVDHVAARNSTCLLSFSRGKDSIAAYLAIRDKFERVVPYFCYLVPGLEFVDESLAYYERVMGCRIPQFPLPSMYKMLRNYVLQPPDRLDLIAAMQLPVLTTSEGHDAIQEAVCIDAGVDYETTFNALGMRASDSVMRKLYFQRHGPLNENRKIFYPVFDWNKQRLVDAIRASGIKLPVDYKIWSSSFDGLRIMYLVGIKNNFPRDWQRVLEFFPFAELEVFRYEASLK